jgi:hypothetical protein
MNETVQSYCKEAGVEFTRCRPYRKNDQAWVEQKNGAVVRRIVGYRRYVGLEAAAALGRLYMSVRLFVNFFQPSFKLAGAANATAPCQSVAAGKCTSTGVRRQCSGLSRCTVPASIRYVTLNSRSHYGRKRQALVLVNS